MSDQTDTYPTQPDTTITVGVAVRSYDFDGQTDCYCDGIVTDLPVQGGCLRYGIVVTRVVSRGKALPLREGHSIAPPVNDTLALFSGRRTMGVVRLSSVQP